MRRLFLKPLSPSSFPHGRRRWGTCGAGQTRLHRSVNGIAKGHTHSAETPGTCRAQATAGATSTRAVLRARRLVRVLPWHRRGLYSKSFEISPPCSSSTSSAAHNMPGATSGLGLSRALYFYAHPSAVSLITDLPTRLVGGLVAHGSLQRKAPPRSRPLRLLQRGSPRLLSQQGALGLDFDKLTQTRWHEVNAGLLELAQVVQMRRDQRGHHALRKPASPQTSQAALSSN